MRSWFRLLPFPLVALAVAAALPHVFPPKDFVEYWSAARVLAAGGDPYSGADLLPVQRDATGNPELTTAVSLWTPPYSLPLYLPLGWLPFGVARWVWLAVQLVLLFAAVELLWRTYAGPPRLWWLPHAVALLFAPTFWLVHYGQNTAFLVLGLAGFLRFRVARPTLAGVFAAVLAVKPHLFAVVAVLLLLDALRDRGWRVLLGGLFALGVASAVAVAAQPRIVEWFVASLVRPPAPETITLKQWRVPLFAFDLRHAIDAEKFWIQFVPCGVACGLMAVHRLLHGRRWEWREQMPAAVLVSGLYAPYGGWVFDLVVLLVPAVQLIARRAWAAVGLLVGVNLLAIRPLDLHEIGWYAPAVGAVWAVGIYSPLLRGRGVRGEG